MTVEAIKDELARRGFKDAAEAIHAAYPGRSLVEQYGRYRSSVPYPTITIGFVAQKQTNLVALFTYEPGSYFRNGVRHNGYRVYGELIGDPATRLIVEGVDAVRKENAL